jgi:hypothetical protein
MLIKKSQIQELAGYLLEQEFIFLSFYVNVSVIA